MHILMLAQFYDPIVGGEERHVQDLSVELAQRGHSVAVITLQQEGLQDRDHAHGVRVYRIRGATQRVKWLFKDPGRLHAPPLPDPEALCAIRRIIAHERPDVVHAHNWLVPSFLPLLAWSEARLVMTLHDYSLCCPTKRLMYGGSACDGPAPRKCLDCVVHHYGRTKGAITMLGNWFMGEVERRAVDMFLPVSRAVAISNGLVSGGLPFQVIPNFVADNLTAVPAAQDARLDQLPQGDFMLFVGDLSAEKGIRVLLEAYTQLRDAPPLVLIGRNCGGIPERLPPRVLSPGIWPHDLVMAAWRRASIALVPSVWPEPFGITAIEAMSAGCPMIAARSGGLIDIVVDGESGVLVPPGDARALGSAMQRLIDDPALRARMSEGGRRRAVEYRASAVVPRIEQVYQSVVATARMQAALQKHGDEERGYRQV